MSDSTEIIEPTKVQPRLGGTQRLYRFANEYGASVIRGLYTYGADEGKWELAVLRWDGEKFELTYDTPITDDVVGYLSEDEVQDHLRRIRDLPAPAVNQ